MGPSLQAGWPPQPDPCLCGTHLWDCPLGPKLTGSRGGTGWKVVGWNCTSPGSEASSGARRTFPWAPRSEPAALQAERAWNQGRGLDSFRKNGTCREALSTDPSGGKGTRYTKHLPTRGQTMGTIREGRARAREPFAQLGPSPTKPKSI